MSVIPILIPGIGEFRFNGCASSSRSQLRLKPQLNHLRPDLIFARSFSYRGRLSEPFKMVSRGHTSRRSLMDHRANRALFAVSRQPDLQASSLRRPGTRSNERLADRDHYAAPSSRGTTPCWRQSSARASPSRCTNPGEHETSNVGTVFTDAAQGLQHHHEQALGLQQPWRTLKTGERAVYTTQWMLTYLTAPVEGHPSQVHRGWRGG